MTTYTDIIKPEVNRSESGLSVGDQSFVSVIIPAYNCARDLEATVRSVQSQVSCRTEIIVIDDSSTDNTPQVIRDLGSEIRSLRVPNGGPGIARNVGAASGSGRVAGVS